jgi:hypothetical protein
MPVINGLQLSQVNDANAAFALAFFPRTKKLHYPKLCGNTRSSRLVEPFTLAGSAPIMQAYNGMLKSMGLKSYKSLVPNLLFKNFEEIDRTELEMDQTRTLRSRAAQFGSRVAEYPDYLLAKRILNGSTAGSQTVVFQGVSYTQTFDGVPFFSASHPHSGTNQSNIIQGTLPNVAATAQANIAQSAAQMQSDLAILVDAICGVKDDKGAPMYPDFDAKTQLIVVVPPALDTIATLAFLTPGVIGGLTTSGTGSNGSSTNLGPQMVKEVVKMGLLKGCPDIEADDPYSTTISPVNPTDWYAFIDGDYTKPFYWQRFVPKRGNEVFPLGEGQDPEAEARSIMASVNNAGLNVSIESAEVYASTEIDTNFGALGANAQMSVVKDEKFFISARARGQITYGPWFTGWRVKPVGGS